MGFSDTVTFDEALPEYGIAKDALFQTKSLYAGGGKFSVTADRRLVEHLYPAPSSFDELVLRTTTKETRDQAAARVQQLIGKRIVTEERRIDYHGDILLFGDAADGSLRSMVARFTHGRLEWVRSTDVYPSENMNILVDQGAR